MQVPLREVEIASGFFQIVMSQQDLNGVQVGAGFEQVSGEAMAQGIVVLLMICIQQRSVIVIIPSMARRLRSSAICGGRALPFSW
jgi:hypothetical protein